MKKNILIIILGVIVLGLGIYIGVDKFTNKPKCECDCDCKTTEESIPTDKSSDDSSSSFNYSNDELDITVNQKIAKITNKQATANPDLGMAAQAELKFDKNVKSVFYGILSNNMGGIYFFLMEDGTVEYMRYSDIYLRNNYTHNTISGVTDVVKIEQANDTDSYGTTIYNVLAYKSDGTTYNLKDYNLFAGDGVSR